MRGRTAVELPVGATAMPFEFSPYAPPVGAVDRHIGARLAGRRQMLGMSIDVIAHVTRLDPATYRNYEAGLERIPAAALFEACRALKVPVRFVFDLYAPGADAAVEWAFHPHIPRRMG